MQAPEPHGPLSALLLSEELELKVLNSFFSVDPWHSGHASGLSEVLSAKYSNMCEHDVHLYS